MGDTLIYMGVVEQELYDLLISLNRLLLIDIYIPEGMEDTTVMYRIGDGDDGCL